MPDQCAIGPNGMLLPANKILFYNDPDDTVPLPGVEAGTPADVEKQGRGFRMKKTTILQASLAAECLDDDGNPIQARPPRTRQVRKKDRPSAQNFQVIAIDTDLEDDDFVAQSDGGGSESDSSSDEEDLMFSIISNVELADTLSSKTIPLTASGATKKRKAPTDVSNAKRPRHRVTIEEVEDDDISPCNTPNSIPLREAPPDNFSSSSASGPSAGARPAPLKKDDSTGSVGSAMGSKKNYIYLFYEQVDANAVGNCVEGHRYYKCYHGNRKIFTITPKMKHNVKSLVHHIEVTFPALYQLYLHLNKRKTNPNPMEVQIASGAKDLDDKAVNAYLKSLELSSKSTLKDAFNAQAMTVWDQDKFESLLAKWMVVCDQPFNEVDKPELRELLGYIHSGARKPLHVPHRTAMKTWIMKMGEDTVEETKEMFSNLESKVSISLDAWTSSNQYAFLAIVAHYITNDGDLEELLIDFKDIIGKHSGENMADVVWTTLELYGLTDKVVAFVMDNATNNDTLVKSIEHRCIALGIPFSAVDARMRCMPHTLHLAAISLLVEIGAMSPTDGERATTHAVIYQESVMASLDDGDSAVFREDDEPEPEADEDQIPRLCLSAIGKLRKIVRAVRSSPQRRESWLKEVKLSDLETAAEDQLPMLPLMLILDVRTRWSSTHDMLREFFLPSVWDELFTNTTLDTIERAIKFESAVNNYVVKNKELQPFELSDTDWSTIRTVTGWLHVFRDATTQMSATKSPMLSSTLAIFRGVQESLKSTLQSLPNDVAPQVIAGLTKAHRKLSDYYTKFDESKYCTWAALLDPRISYEVLRDDFSDDPDLLDHLETSKITLFGHYNTEYSSKYHNRTSTAPWQPSAHYSEPPQAKSMPARVDFTARYNRGPHVVANELQEYFCLPAEDFQACDPVQWWYAHRLQFPNLYFLARDILAIPGSAVAVERIFSGGRDTISLRRARLQPGTIRTLMILKHHLRML